MRLARWLLQEVQKRTSWLQLIPEGEAVGALSNCQVIELNSSFVELRRISVAHYPG